VLIGGRGAAECIDKTIEAEKGYMLAECLGDLASILVLFE
jgi:hypothetical protein